MGLAEINRHKHEKFCAKMTKGFFHDIIAACSKCGGNGWLEKRDPRDEFAGMGPPHAKPCKCRKKVRRLTALTEAGVPREFWRADKIVASSNEDKFEALAEYAGELSAAMDTGAGFVLYGENGTGKSSSAAIPIIAALKKGRTAAFVDFRDLVDGWRRAWKDPEHQQHLDERTSRDIIVLDEVGKEHVGNDEGKFVLSRFDSLLRMRRGEYLPTILVTNLDPIKMTLRYGDSIESLLADRFTHLAYEPGDFRKGRVAQVGTIITGED